MLNEIRLIGRQTGAPEVTTTPGGNTKCVFNIATSKKWKDRDTGDTRERTTFHRCVAWNGLAKIIGQYGAKGALVFVGGEMSNRSYEQDGETRYMHEVIVGEFRLLESRAVMDARASQSASAPAPQVKVEETEQDEIPF